MLSCPHCGQQNPDIARFCLACASPLKQSPPPETRKTVTVVFSDMVGSTALGERLDSEALREVMGRYFSVLRTCLERHGGVVEKFIGDAVMAVFGLPRAHEDDALRACRAALDMKEALAQLNEELDAAYRVRLQNRTGVFTGEVVAGDASTGQRLATGDAVNTAARLEQAAPAGEALLGEPTFKLVKHAVVVEPVEPVAAKGKAQSVPAFRLVEVKAPEDPAGTLGGRLVGRDGELRMLLDAFEEAAGKGLCCMATVVGGAGVGKSRLIAELLSKVGDRARVLRGRCLSYGEGITFWPLAEVIKQAASITDKDSPGEASEKIASLLSMAEDGETLAASLAAAIGLSPSSLALQEIFWAVRRSFEHLASEKPLVVLFDDIHWAEPTFLDLITDVVGLAKAPILVVCAARHDLIEDRPAWAGAIEHAVTIPLEPLEEELSGQLVEQLLGSSALPQGLLGRISSSAQGNPLFVEQMLALWIADGVLSRQNEGWALASAAGSLAVPPTISALLAARLDRLPSSERGVIERGSVVGQAFDRDAVEVLSPETERSAIAAGLDSLTWKQLLGRERTAADEELYRFLHALIRDAAYDGILKRTRADLHERFGSWLEESAGDRLEEVQEIVGHHLAQAFVLLTELAVVDERGHKLAQRAGLHLASAGKRAFDREDVPGAAKLLERASSLLGRGDPTRLRSLLDLAVAHSNLGHLERAISLQSEALAEAIDVGDTSLEWTARVERARLLLASTMSRPWAEVRAMALEAIDALQDDLGLSRAWQLLAMGEQLSGRVAAAAEATERVKRHARRAGDLRLARRATEQALWMSLQGVTPASEVLLACDRALAEARGSPHIEAIILHTRSTALAYGGRFPDARSCLDTGMSIAADLEQPALLFIYAGTRGEIELLAGDARAAESHLRFDCDGMLRIGEEMSWASEANKLAEVLLDLGRAEEALELTRRSEAIAMPDDLDAQVRWRMVRARVLAATGLFNEAEPLAREAVRLAEGTEFLALRAHASEDLARVLYAAGQTDAALPVAETALRLYEQKEIMPLAERARGFVDELKNAQLGAP